MLPIDREIPAVIASLREHQALVLEAPPGAGKTTRVPWALLDQDFTAGRSIAVSEPRRLAAKLAAHFVARELGEEVGQRVGYQVRFEARVGPETRLRYQTAGVLLQQLLHRRGREPTPGVVILDEFHERQIENDQLLALLSARLREDRELRLVVMSATLDAERIASFLGAPRIRSEGKLFPLRIEHDGGDTALPLESRVSSAVKRALSEQPQGHVLVFLPTVRDIQRAQAKLESARRADVEILPLHGDLSLAEQTRAVSDAAKRKVVLSTNVAESSLTVPGVTAVIDTGLARLAVDSPWSGRRELVVYEISQASAVQRAGRAGRTAPGVVYRLFSEHSFRARREQEIPEILRSDLSDTWLRLLGAGFADPAALPWLDAPPEPALRAAQQLLQALGALDEHGKLTSIGKRMLRFTVHPRLARLIVAGEDLGVTDTACLAAALLAEKDIVRRGDDAAHSASDSDVIDRCDRFREARDARFAEHRLRQLGLQRSSVQAVDRAQSALRSAAARGEVEPVDPDLALRQALLAAFPDRVARRRTAASKDLILSNGTSARLGASSCVHDAIFLLVHDVERRVDARGRSDLPWVNLATRIEPDWLLDLPGLREERELCWNADKECVELSERLRYGSVVLDESRKRAAPGDDTSQELARAAAAHKARFLGKTDSIATFARRLKLLAERHPDLELPTFDGDDSALFLAACQGLTSFAELEALDWPSLLSSHLNEPQRRALERELPLTIALPGGRQLRINYERDKMPWVSSRLQDFFGMKQTPSLCGGAVPLTLHLLAPNQRAVQVTTDLSGFWERHYPALRRELMRRYPRHAWPEDPLTAKPPSPQPRRRP